jgi:hypothetical protein
VSTLVIEGSEINRFRNGTQTFAAPIVWGIGPAASVCGMLSKDALQRALAWRVSGVGTELGIAVSQG